MFRDMPKPAIVYLIAIVIAGWSALLSQLVVWESADIVRFLLYVAVFVVASCLKVWLPGITGNMSVNYVFVLLAILELTLQETVAMVAVGAIAQMFWHSQMKPRVEQVLFNVAGLVLAAFLAYQVYHSPLVSGAVHGNSSLLVASAATVYFLANTFSVAGIIGASESKSPLAVWRECYIWSFPYYLLGGAIAAGVAAVNRTVGWQTTVLALPALFIVYKSYGLYLTRLEDEARHAREMASLHLRTIEALAAAIEAKDEGTHKHLERVQTYAVEMGKTLKLDKVEIEAIRAASILHDIGKLAVPEHIISKPGKLTHEEFDKMKIHPVVGADILDRVQFPYPVAPIVRHHHEKWDGTGYPDGLHGADIPIGARILSIVDCLDALATDRPYRRALPLRDSLAYVVSESGKSYDPELVTILARNCEQWERKARSSSMERVKLETEIRVGRGNSPGAGFQESPAIDTNRGAEKDFTAHIAAARQEVQALYELSLDLGSSLSLEETMSVLDIRLRRLVTYDSIVILTKRENKLVPVYANGIDSPFFSHLEIPLGEGLSGWVAETGKTILNGNPTVESGYLRDERQVSALRSSIAVPLQHPDGIVGVVALHHAKAGWFTQDHLRILLAIAPKLALAVRNVENYQQARKGASTDGLTGLPNARSLFLHLDREVDRCVREGATLELLVCDLDGFKNVNDNSGHLVGNEVLRLIAGGFQAVCRSSDYVARMGGDEFVLILSGGRQSELDRIVGRLNEVVAEVGRKACETSTLSASFGAAWCPVDGTDAETLLTTADRRMYESKRHKKTRPQPENSVPKGARESLITLLRSVADRDRPRIHLEKPKAAVETKD